MRRRTKREKTIISAVEYEIAESLAEMKTVIDQWIYLNYHRLDNEDAFKQDVLSLIGKKLLDLDIPATISDRKYINNLITTEYFQQRASAY